MVEKTVIFKTGDTIPLDSLFCPISAVGSSFFLLITEKDVLEGDLTVNGIIYTESALFPCTFGKMDIFMLQLRQSIPVDFSVKCQVDQEDLMIMDEKSYHQILTLQRDMGPFLLPWRNAFK